MHLKSLVIQGFKSFPERTIIEFDKGVTAIIGPNGSGKSNVTDAIRWVLGEQSVKTLRGSRMEDVIFTGTQSRRAMGFAEVSMIIDNSDGFLPLDYTEIQITRRLYRSGESEYLLNNTICRLKDIAMLLMDTGLGRDGYSIVGQGRVDDILSNRSEDRRKIFEEASGIVKYKTRKDEAERKLQNTEQNLLRINDIVSELESRLEPLAKQAEAAKRYLDWREELKGLEIAQMLENIDQHQERLQEVLAEKKLLQDDLDREDQALVDLKNEKRKSSERMIQIDRELDQQQQQAGEVNSKINELNGQIALCTEKIQQQQNLQEKAAAEEEQIEKNLDNLRQELAERNDRADILLKQVANYRQQLEDAESNMEQVLATLGDAEKSIEEFKVNLDNLLEEVFQQREDLNQTKSQTNLIESRRQTIGAEIREMISDKDRLRLLLEEEQTRLRQIRTKAAAKQEKQQKLAAELQQVRAKLTDLRQKLDQDRQAIANHRYRHKTLVELEKSYAGYGETVRVLLQKAEKEKDFARGVLGTLGSLIRVEQKYELAVETALGPAIQQIVTDDENTASRLIEWLKQSRSGRATFLPISSIRERSLDSGIYAQVQKMPGFIGLASKLVSYEPDIESVIANLLARVVIVENLEQAVQMARKTGHKCRFVTLEGDVINPGGSMSGGYSRHQGSSVLRRGREIENLQTQITQLENNIQHLESKLPDAELREKELALDYAAREKEVIELDQQLVRAEAGQKSLLQEQEKVSARQKMLEAEDKQLQAEAAKINREIGTMAKEIEDNEKRIADLRQAIKEHEGASRSEQEKRDDLRETITDLKVSLNSIEESLTAAREMAQRISRERQLQEDKLEQQRQNQQDSRSQVDWLKDERLRLRSKIESLQKEGVEIAAALQDLAGERSRLESEQSAYFDQLEQAGNRLAALQAEIGRCDTRVERSEIQVDEIKNRMWEIYEMTADQAESLRRAQLNKAETSRRINKLKSDMKNLGDVNLAAIEENASLQERYRFMVSQRDDIESSRSRLVGVIDDLVEAMKKQFTDHFYLINENFKLVFSELFGGGMAEINLEDEADVLSCNIEIRAQPPGKRLQNMMLLSGGERCLTAIALLFAILNLRPTPFCVLDEVEASLDDANVSRFTDYIRRYAGDSQFILVTHRKGTMEAADRLYGVTMQERGISRILSMKLSD